MSLSDEALLLSHFGHLPNFRKVGTEWKSSCPNCLDIGHDYNKGLPDRFFMNIPGNGYKLVRGKCRRCGHSEAAFEPGQGRTIDEAARMQMEAEQQKADERRQARAATKRRQLSESGMALQFYEHMTDTQRVQWYGNGFVDRTIEQYKLGFVSQRTFGPKDGRFTTDAMTIPQWYHDWQVSNIQFRLLDPPTPDDKYRPLPGLPIELFMTDPDLPLTMPVIIGEGAKKAMILRQYLGHEKRQATIVAVPSKMPPSRILMELSQAERIFIILDPDAFKPMILPDGTVIPPAIERNLRILHNNNPDQDVYPIWLPVKLDDFFTVFDGTVSLLKRYFKDARKVIYENKRYANLF